jgi:hypothetical protein
MRYYWPSMMDGWLEGRGAAGDLAAPDERGDDEAAEQDPAP